jgi:lysophospholipase L1-like esterase
MFGSRLEVKRFEDRILAYESRPLEEETGKILFYGHSLFTRCSWITKAGKDNPKLADEVRMKDGSLAIVNHGFGTSSADDLLYYYPRMVRPYKPRVLVLATGGNDIGNGYSPEDIMQILARIIDWSQADFPGIPIYCVGPCPTLKGKGVKDYATKKRDEFDDILETYCAKKEGVTYISMVNQPFFYENAEDVGDRHKVREDIYAADRGHLNPKGYAMFMDFIREYFDEYL